jgi:hypothetical protein
MTEDTIEIDREKLIALQKELEEMHSQKTDAERAEEVFRRGYSQGFYAARLPENAELTVDDIYKWRCNIDKNNIFDTPPGSYHWHMKKQRESK